MPLDISFGVTFKFILQLKKDLLLLAGSLMTKKYFQPLLLVFWLQDLVVVITATMEDIIHHLWGISRISSSWWSWVSTSRRLSMSIWTCSTSCRYIFVRYDSTEYCPVYCNYESMNLIWGLIGAVLNLTEYCPVFLLNLIFSRKNL